MKRSGMGSHESARMKNDEHLTPPRIIHALGEFDLDPCSPINRPWDTAKQHYNILDDGLSLPWEGRVWCNPPYGKEAEKWLEKLAGHGNGIALIFARTETKMFFSQVWGKANAVLFLRGRLSFLTVKGDKQKGNAGAPSVLVAYGQDNAIALDFSGIEGQFIQLR